MRKTWELFLLLALPLTFSWVQAQTPPSAPPLTQEQLDRLHAVKAWDIEFTYHFTEIQNGGGDVTTSYYLRPVDHWSVSHNHDKQFVMKVTVAGKYGQSDCAIGSDSCLAKYQYPASVSGIQESFSRLDEIHFSDGCSQPPDTTTGPGFHNSHQTWTVSGTKNLDGTGYNFARGWFELHYDVNPPTAGGAFSPNALDYDVTLDHAGCIQNDHTTFNFSSDFYLVELYPYVPGDKQVRIENGSFVIRGSGTEHQTFGVASGWVPAAQSGGAERTWYREWVIREHIDSSITVTRPTADMLFIGGETDTIRWTTIATDSVRILYSVNSGTDYTEIADSIPASAHEYVWKIPDTLLSHFCRIKVQSMTDPVRFGESESFKMKAYVLTRIGTDGNYERYVPNRHGWSFSNTDTNMWPQSWWSNFDYEQGIDPFTNRTYPNEFTDLPIFAVSRDFPDWPLFVKAFGVNASYIDVFEDLEYRPSALIKWKDVKDDWGGSCFGFAITSYLGFDYYTEFLNKFPEIGNFNDLYDFPISNVNRNVINENFLYQFGQVFQQHVQQNWAKTPSETLEGVKEMLLSDNRGENGLLLFNQGGAGAHIINPYRAEKFGGNPSFWWIYVYDSNIPGSSSQRVFINTSSNLWSYDGLGWSGNRGLFLTDPIENYLMNPVSSQKRITASPVTSVQLFTNSASSILITDAAGNSIGYSDSTIIDSMSNAFSIIPIIGKEHPPIGYYLPDGAYSVMTSNFSDSVSRVSIHTGSSVCSYSRINAHGDDTDYVSWQSGAVTLTNPDSVAKPSTLQYVLTEPNSEKAFDLNFSQTPHDSLRVSSFADQDLLLSNFGAGKSYDLKLRFVSTQGSGRFEHHNITLEPNALHHVMPSWNNLGNEPLRILIDNGIDGSIDDSVLVDNILGVRDQDIHMPTAFALSQNYPNPFNPVTTIRYELPIVGLVMIKVFNVVGENVTTLVNETKGPGIYNVNWDASQVPSGVYFYQLTAVPIDGGTKSYARTRAMVVMK